MERALHWREGKQKVRKLACVYVFVILCMCVYDFVYVYVCVCVCKEKENANEILCCLFFSAPSLCTPLCFPSSPFLHRHPQQIDCCSRFRHRLRHLKSRKASKAASSPETHCIILPLLPLFSLLFKVPPLLSLTRTSSSCRPPPLLFFFNRKEGEREDRPERRGPLFSPLLSPFLSSFPPLSLSLLSLLLHSVFRCAVRNV